MAHVPDETPRGLWSVMRRGDPSFAEGLVEEPPVPVEEASEAGPQEAGEVDAESSPARGKGLWAMMGLSSAVPSLEASPVEEPSIKNEDAVSPPAWFRGKVTSPEPQPEPPATEEPLKAAAEPEPPQPKPFVEPVQNVPEPIGKPFPAVRSPLWVEPVETPARARISNLAVKTGRSRGAMQSFLVGLFAIPLTLLAMRPEVWTRIPAAVVGFGALVIGLIAFHEIQRSRGQQTGKRLAIAGMVLGTLAMFLGPLVVAPWSESRNQISTQSITQNHLESIGHALKKYHAQYKRFPPGGTYRLEEQTGKTRPMHSWMTQLLPYLGANETYQQINRSAPWNEPLNKPPMGKSINAFLAGGIEQTHNQAGYGLSHFAAVGGLVKTGSGRYANVGIFERESNVTQKDVRDGLSQTLIAGEIPEGFRPWGEPGNWRILGEGLNRDSDSFGNPEGTGALFLKADGSVQFFSNGVSADILERLSTRDGEDNRMIPEQYR